MSLRIATGGNVDAGKSTFTACLAKKTTATVQLDQLYLPISTKKNPVELLL